MKSHVSSNIASILAESKVMIKGSANEKRSVSMRNYWIYISDISAVCRVSKTVAREYVSWGNINVSVNNLRRIINERKSNTNVPCRAN